MHGSICKSKNINGGHRMAVTAAGTPSFKCLLKRPPPTIAAVPQPDELRLFNVSASLPRYITPRYLSPPSPTAAAAAATHHITRLASTCSGASERAMEKSSKMVAVVAVLVLAVAAEARNIKTTEAASKDAVVQPQTFPPFDRLGSASPAFGGLPGGSIPGFSLPGSSGVAPGFGSIGSMPFLGGFGGGSPGLGGFGGMPGSPAAAVDEHAKKP